MKLNLLFAMIWSALIFGGCFAHKFSSSLLPFKDDEKTKTAFQEVVVALAEPIAESYELTKLTAALQKTSLFKEAGAIDQLSRPPDLILVSWFYEGERGKKYKNCSLGFEGELLMIAIAGLIPQICESRHRVSFDLYSPKTKKNISVTFAYETGGAVGWAALLYNASSDWTVTAPGETISRFVKGSILPADS